VLLVALLFSASIEFAQLFIRDRSADVDDVMLNVIGALLGYLLLSMFRLGRSIGRISPRKEP
jgi:glycopeptide antibiotics resistance protein